MAEEKVLSILTNANLRTSFNVQEYQQINHFVEEGWTIKSVSVAGAAYGAGKDALGHDEPAGAAFFAIVVLQRK